MINVLHLRDTDRVCGPGKTIIETACALDSLQFRTKVAAYVLNREKGNAFLDAASRRGISVLPIRTRTQWDPRVIGQLLRLIKEQDIHVVHAHEYKSDLLAFILSRVKPIPIMTTVHGLIVKNWKSRVYIGLDRRVIRHFGRVVAVSEETRRMLQASGVPPERLVVIHNGIVIDDYRRDRQPKGLIRARFGLPPDAVLVGNVGRLSAEKGQRDFLTAAAAVASAYPAARFLLIGSGPDGPTLKAQAHSLGIADRVCFTGHLDDVRPAYADLDVVALTSYTEGLPNVLLEALCMDVPVLATSVGGVPEIVQDGLTGVLVPAGRPDDVARGLCRLLGDRSWALGLAEMGRRRVEGAFSFGSRVAKEARVYHELARGREP